MLSLSQNHNYMKYHVDIIKFGVLPFFTNVIFINPIQQHTAYLKGYRVTYLNITE